PAPLHALPYTTIFRSYTVRVHASEPAPTLWDTLGREPLVPKAWTIKNGVDALNDKPVGTGAWKLVEWRRKTSMVLERNDAYWGPGRKSTGPNSSHQII